jgi:hypothetical protein
LFIVPKNPARTKAKLKTFLSNGQVVIQSEFTDQLEALTTAYMAEHKPVNATEKMLVMDMATAQCRFDYALRLQSQPGVAANEKLVASLVSYQLTNQRLYKRSLKMLRDVQKEREREAARKPHLVKPKKAGEH